MAMLGSIPDLTPIQQRINSMVDQLTALPVGQLFKPTFPGSRSEVWVKVSNDSYRCATDWPTWNTQALAQTFHAIELVPGGITMPIMPWTAAQAEERRKTEQGR